MTSTLEPQTQPQTQSTVDDVALEQQRDAEKLEKEMQAGPVIPDPQLPLAEHIRQLERVVAEEERVAKERREEEQQAQATSIAAAPSVPTSAAAAPTAAAPSVPASATAAPIAPTVASGSGAQAVTEVRNHSGSKRTIVRRGTKRRSILSCPVSSTTFRNR